MTSRTSALKKSTDARWRQTVERERVIVLADAVRLPSPVTTSPSEPAVVVQRIANLAAKGPGAGGSDPRQFGPQPASPAEHPVAACASASFPKDLLPVRRAAAARCSRGLRSRKRPEVGNDLPHFNVRPDGRAARRQVGAGNAESHDPEHLRIVQPRGAYSQIRGLQPLAIDAVAPGAAPAKRALAFLNGFATGRTSDGLDEVPRRRAGLVRYRCAGRCH